MIYITTDKNNEIIAIDEYNVILAKGNDVVTVELRAKKQIERFKIKDKFKSFLKEEKNDQRCDTLFKYKG